MCIPTCSIFGLNSCSLPPPSSHPSDPRGIHRKTSDVSGTLSCSVQLLHASTVTPVYDRAISSAFAGVLWTPRHVPPPATRDEDRIATFSGFASIRGRRHRAIASKGTRVFRLNLSLFMYACMRACRRSPSRSKQAWT
ncbi:hypothetical protein OH77DRAFT_1017604 [Trametes cingulata]|nr:hypothetical protein OH77DRAFT_1017604 [Trametes cingulata]